MTTERGTYTPDSRQPYRTGRHPARCNKRGCQARRNLSKHPMLYVKWPKCHVCGDGLMYVDWYRMKKGPKDNAPKCELYACAYRGSSPEYHRVSDSGCSGHAEYLAKRNNSPRSKHSPIPEADWVPF